MGHTSKFHMKIFILLLLISMSFLPGYTPAQELYFRHYTINDGLLSNEVHSIREDSSGLLWLATDRGLMQYDGYSFRELPVAGTHAIYPWFGIKRDPYNSTIYFTGFNGDVALYKNGLLTLHPDNNMLKKIPIATGITSFSAKRDSLWFSFDNENDIMLYTPDGNIFRESHPDGLHYNQQHNYMYLINPGKASNTIPVFVTWQNQRQTRDSIILPPTRTLNFLHHEQMDSFDLLIAGIQILCYKDGKRQWHKSFPSDILSFHMLDETHVLIGLRNHGVSLYEFKSGILTGPYYTWLRDLSVTNIYRDIQNGFWFTTIENGVFYTHPTQAVYWPGRGKINSISSRGGKTYAVYSSGQIRVFRDKGMVQGIHAPMEADATHEHHLFNKTNYQVKRIDTGLNEKLPSLPETGPGRNINITCMQHDERGGIWIGSYQGLKYYRNGILTDFSSRHPGFSRRITGLGFLSGKYLAVATLGDGLILIKDSILHSMHSENGLPATIINDMDIHRDTIWLGTNKGISRIIFLNDSFRVWHYGSAYGLPTLGINKLAVSEKWIYFDWVSNIVAIEKNKLQNLYPSTPPLIKSILVNESDTISLPAILRYNQNTIKINYNSINLANGPGQIYRYRLDGFDNTWRTTTERQVVFANLPPGSFTFTVEVADGQGIFIPQAATFSFTIRPAFWQQWWFPYAVGMLVLLIAFIMFTNHLKAVKNKNQLLLSLAENQQKALVQLINPHFIFNVLNSFSSAVATENKMNALTIISRFTRLIRMSIELARKKNVMLRDEIDLLEKYLELEHIRFPDKFTYTIDIDPAIDPGNTEIPGMLIQPFVENAINHGIMHLFGKMGHIVISFDLQQSLILCTVEDNGVGRALSGQINAHKEIGHESTGIPVTLQRLLLLHEEKQKKYIYIVTDKKDDEGKPAGTKVIFSIPYTLKEHRK